MTTLSRARAAALALPQATEQDHHGMASFRIRGKIFATVPDAAHLRIMLEETEIRATVAEHPGVCQELYWGKRLSCVVVDLARATSPLVEDLLAEAWARSAPKGRARELG
jgi:hypothetical protein